jgi:hypothetical protein
VMVATAATVAAVATITTAGARTGWSALGVNISARFHGRTPCGGRKLGEVGGAPPARAQSELLLQV